MLCQSQTKCEQNRLTRLLRIFALSKTSKILGRKEETKVKYVECCMFPFFRSNPKTVCLADLHSLFILSIWNDRHFLGCDLQVVVFFCWGEGLNDYMFKYKASMTTTQPAQQNKTKLPTFLSKHLLPESHDTCA